MYQMHWGLRESPFGVTADAKRFHPSPTHDEALARLQFLVQQRRRLGLLLGPSGSGKSFLLEILAAELRRNGRPVAKLSLLGLEPAEMLWRLVASWGVSLDPTDALSTLWRVVADRLAEYRYQQIEAVALLDDADQADRQVLQHVTRLVRCNASPDVRLTVVLAGRGEAMLKLGARLLDLADLRIDLEPWEPADTEEFLNSVLTAAGRELPVFEPAAVTRLHELSQGIPRRISQLADLALVAGASQHLEHIDANVVEEVYRELAT